MLHSFKTEKLPNFIFEIDTEYEIVSWHQSNKARSFCEIGVYTHFSIVVITDSTLVSLKRTAHFVSAAVPLAFNFSLIFVL